MTIGAFKLNSISKALASVSYISATGGTVTYVNSSGIGYKCHTFTTVGNTSFIVSAGGSTAEMILVGGGGGSGGNASSGSSGGSGGGGGGRVVSQTGITVTPQTYTVTVGAGGTAGTTSGTNGGTGGTTSALGTSSVGGTGSAGSAGTATAAGAAGGGGGSFYPGGVTKAAATGTFGGGAAQNGGTGSTQGSGGGGSNIGAGTASSGGIGGNGGAPTTTYFRGRLDELGPGGVGRGANGTGTNGATLASPWGAGADPAYSTSAIFAGNAGLAGGAMIRYPMASTFSVDYVTNVTSTASTVAIPATAQVGDIAILVDWGYITSTTSPTSVTPTGFTLIGQHNQITSPASRIMATYKVLVAGDPGATITGMSTTSMRKILMIYRPSIAYNSITVNSGTFNTASTTPGSQNISPATKEYVLEFGIWGSSAGTIGTRTSTLTSSRELSIAGQTNLYVNAFELLEGSITTNTLTFPADYGTNVLASFFMKFN